MTLQQRKDRIEEVLRALDDFKEQREGDHSRREYVRILKDDLKNVYDYGDWLLSRLMYLFSPRELFEFMEANEKPRPLTVRTNTLKTTRRDLAQALTTKGMSVQPIGAWSKVGLQVFESDVAVGSTTEYLAGQYLVQSASSFLPVMSLAPAEGMRVLDMSAAPGGKTTHIAQIMKNTGTLFANDVSAERLVALRGNMLRMGIVNAVVTNYNGVGFERVLANFDRVLLDAPCTGVGVISRDPKIKYSKSEKDVQICADLQRRLLLSAVDCCKVGGFVVYSTCSILVEENEGAVDYVLRHRKVRVVETGLPFGRPGFTKYRKNRFHPSVEQSRRYYPHLHNMDGFYVCRLEKVGQGADQSSKWYREPAAPTAPVHTPMEERELPQAPDKVLRRKAAAAAAAAAADAPPPAAGGGKKRKRKREPVAAAVPPSFKAAASAAAAPAAPATQPSNPGAGARPIPITIVAERRKMNAAQRRRAERRRDAIAERKKRRQAKKREQRQQQVEAGDGGGGGARVERVGEKQLRRAAAAAPAGVAAAAPRRKRRRKATERS